MTVTCDLSLSLDGYSTGYDQRADAPFGDGVDEVLHEWMFEHGAENADEVAAILEAGAYIMGRNMFGPIRGEWTGDWRGWWGAEPPYHGPVFVLTHFAREPVEMDGGTTFAFVTEGPQRAMDAARAAAGERSVAIAGGASTINEFLDAGLIDELRLHIAPLVVGLDGHGIVRLFDGVDRSAWDIASARATAHVTHVTYHRR